MTGPITRILLRYAAAALVAKGLFSPDMGDAVANDADLLAVGQVVVGGVAMVVSEGWYWLARRFDWAK